MLCLDSGCYVSVFFSGLVNWKVENTRHNLKTSKRTVVLYRYMLHLSITCAQWCGAIHRWSSCLNKISFELSILPEITGPVCSFKWYIFSFAVWYVLWFFCLLKQFEWTSSSRPFSDSGTFHLLFCKYFVVKLVRLLKRIV